MEKGLRRLAMLWAMVSSFLLITHARLAYTHTAAATPGLVLRYYVQLELGSAGLAFFLNPLNTSFSGPFGTGTLFAFNATQLPSRHSKLIGVVRGFTLEASYLPSQAHGVEVAYIHYDDGSFNGTIQIQGEVLNSNSEVAIIGGTGSFRGARGYLLISLASISEPFRVFFHELHFM